MAKFRLSNDSVFTIGGSAVTCVTDIEFSEDADVYFSDCDDASGYKEPVVGGIQVTGNLTMEYNADDNTVLGYFDPQDSGALVFGPNGTTSGDLKIEATTLTVTNRQIRASRTGLSTASCSFVCDDFTVGAYSA